MRWAAGVAAAIVLGGGLFEPALFRSGEAPELPARAAGGGHVALEVTVGADGQVSGVNVLRGAAPFTDQLRTSVARWRFEPGRENGRALEATVLVAAWFRSAALLESAGPLEFPPSTARASEAIPVPTVVGVPAYPAIALGDGVVVVEVAVGTEGEVRSARVVLSAAGFDAAAMDAARRWRFRPASRADDQPVPSVAYLVFGFRSPVTPRRP
jgi:TonB family protein